MYQVIIGMEVHVELKTKSKMFSRAKNEPEGDVPNTHIDEVVLGHPGTLPVPNKKAIEWTVLIGKALGCSIRELSKFDRKHYFYPDLPKGYQISQYDEPIAENGSMTLHFILEENVRDTAVIGIERAHLEEDTAKLTHDASGNTLVDFNRAGVPLVEIVTKPDFKTAAEAKMFCKELQQIMRYLNVSDANMEKGQMRCEANVSVQKVGSFEIVDGLVKPLNGVTLNNKVEVKNINSFKAVERAINFEIKRQTALIEAGETWTQQTRGWDENKNETVLQRIKENAADYRYFPEPDIPPFEPLVIAGEVRIPELPLAKRMRFHNEYKFSYADALLLTASKDIANYTEAVMSELYSWIKTLEERNEAALEPIKDDIAKLAGGWLTSKLTGALNDLKKSFKDIKFTPENFAELVALIYTKKVTSTNASKILKEMVQHDTDIDPTHIMEEKGYGQVSNTDLIETIVDDIIVKFPDQVQQFKDGKDPIIKFLVGMVMKASQGTANPQIAEEVLRKKLT